MNKENQNVITAGSKLAKAMAERGFRLFSRTDAVALARQLGYTDSYSKQVIFHLKQGGWIEMIRPGLYCLNSIFLNGNPIHEFEIANHLAENIVISHFSALHHYGFSDQIPQTIYMTVKTGTRLPRSKKGESLSIWGVNYHFSQIKESHFFGHKKIWVGDIKISITDPERTLLDGLIKPGCCGGIQEVLNAFKMNINNVNVLTLIEYGLKLDASISKRLGWVLASLDIPDHVTEPLRQLPFKGYTRLEASGSKSGHYNKIWQVQENL